MSTHSSERRTVLFTGHVQGVGFRYTTRQIAERYPVTGYVRNLPDGRVELLAEGDPATIDQMLEEVRRHFAGHIADEQTDAANATGEYTGFDIRQ